MGRLLNRLRQYGITYTLKKTIRIAVKPFFFENRFLVFARLQERRNELQEDLRIVNSFEDLKKVLASSVADKFAIGVLKEQTNFNNEIVILYMDSNWIAGHAHVQTEGKYKFGRCSYLTIPERAYVMKNLYVAPDFRGRGIGTKLNRGRLSVTPPDVIPFGFIICGNRYAIRNWKKAGMELVGEVRERFILGRRRVLGKSFTNHPVVVSMIEQARCSAREH